MLMKTVATIAVIAFLMLAVQARAESASVELEALLGDTAVLMINGQRKMLRVGQSFAGVTLVAAQPTAATRSPTSMPRWCLRAPPIRTPSNMPVSRS